MTTPEALPNTPFRRADHARYGLTEHTVDSHRFLRPFPGVRLLRSAHAPEPERYGRTFANAHNFAPLLTENDMFSHTTALRLYGCPIVGDDVLHVSVPFGRAPTSIQGVTGHRYRARMARVLVRGLPVVPPVRALLQSAPLLSERELIVAIDHLVCPRRSTSGLVSLDTVGRSAMESSHRGVRALRRALDHARTGAESRYETLLRLELVSRGFTDLELQVPLKDAAGFVGCFDLVSRSHAAIFEYDGEQHRTDRQQYLSDIDRLDRARYLGWNVLRFHYRDITISPQRITEKLSRANLPR